MPKQDGGAGIEQIDANMAEIILRAPSGMRYSDVKTLVIANGTAQSVAGAKVGDDDGDANDPVNASVTGTMKATWYDGSTAVSEADLSKALDPCGGPYTLKIEIPTDVSAKTTYGIPNSTQYGSSTGVVYTFNANKRGICYLQPYSMHVYKGTEGTNIKYADGYNPATWVASKGFKPEAGFPTTGFHNAVFSIIGFGNDQSKYRCSTTAPASSISLSGTANSALGENCKVTYTAVTKKAFGSPTIKMEYNSGTTENPKWVEIDSYDIPVPTRWAIGKGVLSYGNEVYLSRSSIFPTLDACQSIADGKTPWSVAAGQTTANRTARQRFMFRRDELTNSPFAYTEEGSAPTNIVTSFYSRDVDGTFTGEWGNVQTYPNSDWALSTSYWTAEAFSTEKQYSVSTVGDIASYFALFTQNLTLCRG